MNNLEVTLIILAASFAVGTLAMKILLPMLIRLKTGQNIREEGPESHKAKAGTPSMGGLAIISTTVIIYAIATAALWHFDGDFVIITACFLLFCAVGFWDDFIKIKKKHNLGLRAWQKLLLQIAISFLVAWYVANYTVWGTTVYIPYFKIFVDFGGWFIPFIAFAIIAMTNAVNLTDGLDGLAGGVTALVAFFFASAAAIFDVTSSMFYFAALSGACLGFLIYNHHPAKVFMGDTGSLALGGGLAIAAIISNTTLLLPIAGFIYVMEALSVIIQVASFKLTGKRVFRMAPIHHHFELGGMKETKVVTLFWVLTLIFCILGFLGI